MTVKQLITQLLDMPIDSNVVIAYMDDEYDYKYQEAYCAVKIDTNSEVCITGWRNGE